MNFIQVLECSIWKSNINLTHIYVYRKTQIHGQNTTVKFKGKIDQFILINLGATVDFLNIDEDGNQIHTDDQTPLINDQDEMEIFIIDSHRPVNLIKYGSYLFFKRVFL